MVINSTGITCSQLKGLPYLMPTLLGFGRIYNKQQGQTAFLAMDGMIQPSSFITKKVDNEHAKSSCTHCKHFGLIKVNRS